MPEYSVLPMTDRAGEGGVCPPLLAHQAVFSRSCLTHAMERLEPRGLTECRPCESGGRGGPVSLTPVGKTPFSEAALVQRDAIRHLFLGDVTSGETDMLTGLFTRVSERLSFGISCPWARAVSWSQRFSPGPSPASSI